MDKTNFTARRRVWGAVMRGLMVLCAVITCALAAFLIIYVLAKGVPNLSWQLLSTKKQAQEAIKDEAARCGQYYVNARWLGGMMTNFKTMRTRIDRLNQLKTMQTDGTFDMLPKKEVIKHLGEIEKLEIGRAHV